MTAVAVIPARGGSKRIPRKNIRPFGGKPIIAWSIEAALASRCFESVVVSTDDEEIAAVAREWGGTTPFLRPPSLADDMTGTVPVVRHAVEWLSKAAKRPTLVCCIYATAPFVTADDILRGREVLTSAQADFAVSVTSFPFPIQRAVKISPDGRLEMFHPEHALTRSQDLEEAFHDAGQFYWGTSEAWQRENSLFLGNAAPVLLPRHRVQDIDTLEDWQRAELMFKASHSRS